MVLDCYHEDRAVKARSALRILLDNIFIEPYHYTTELKYYITTSGNINSVIIVEPA